MKFYTTGARRSHAQTSPMLLADLISLVTHSLLFLAYTWDQTPSLLFEELRAINECYP